MGVDSVRPRARALAVEISGVSPLWVFIGGIILLCLFFTLYPSVMLLRGSLSTGKLASPGDLTLANYATVYLQPDTYKIFGTTVVYAGCVALVAVLVGFLFAWISVRTDAPLARHMPWLVLIPYVVPATLSSVCWTILANPNTGLLNLLARSLFGPDVTPFNIYSMAGMVLVSATYSGPLVFTFLAAALRTSNPALEEAASLSGASPLKTFWRVSVPLARPALISVFALIFILGLEAFDVPAFIGIPSRIYVFTTAVFIQTSVRTPPNYGQAATYGALPLLVALLLTVYYQRSIVAPERFATITGKAFHPRRVLLQRWRWVATGIFLLVFFITAVLPFVTLVLISLAPSLSAVGSLAFGTYGLGNYATIFSDPTARRAMSNSLLLAIVGATLAVGASFLISTVLLRTRLRGRGLLEYLLFLPFAFPSIVLAVGLIWGYVRFPLGIYGTLWILLVGYITKYLPYGLRSISTTLLQVNREMEEAARVSGATPWHVLSRVLFPLALPGLVAGWSLLVIVFLREFSMSLMLWTSGNEVVSVIYWDDWSNGRFGPLGALGMLLVMASLVIVFTIRRATRVDKLVG